MFGLSTKEVLMKAILNASKNKAEIYKQGLMANVDVLNGNEEAEREEVFFSIQKEYLDEVANTVINTFDVSSPTTAAKIKLTLISPSLCGYEDIDISNGIMAGALYAICYHAITNKVAEPRDCVKLNHLQYDVMNNALAELDREL